MTAPETLAERLATCVKPLEWVRCDQDDGIPEWQSGAYIIEYCSVGYVLCVGGAVFAERFGDNGEAAKAAAQADYQSRILAALDMDAIARLVAEAVEMEREGCARFVDCGCDPAKKAAAVNGGNSGDRWRACQEANCGAQDAAAIRARAAQTEKEG